MGEASPRVLRRSFMASATGVGTARSWVDRSLTSMGASDGDRRDLVLVVSELVSNVVQFGEVRDVPVVVHRTSTGWEVQIAGGRTPPPDLEEWTIAPAAAVSGRGLGIVRRLVDEVTVERRDGRVVICCRRSAQP